MEKLDKITDVKVAEQQTEVDPRSKTTADKAFNLIGTGGPKINSKHKEEIFHEYFKVSKKITCICQIRKGTYYRLSVR